MGHNPTSPGASEPVEARSLSELLTLASDPPAYPRNPTHKKLEPLSLYIVRVPGSKDVFLSPLKPGQKDSISPESLGASLYFLHVSSPEDEVLLQQVKEELGEAKPKSEEESPNSTEDPQEQEQYTSGDEGYYENGTQLSQVSQVYYHELQEQPSNSSWKSKEPPGPGHLSYTCSNGQKFEIVTRPGRRRPEPVVDESDTDEATPTNGSQQDPPPVSEHVQPVVNEPVASETSDRDDSTAARPPPTPVRGDVAEEARHILPYVGGSQPDLPLELERGSMDTVRQSNVDQQRQHEREAATAALHGQARSQPQSPGQDDMVNLLST
ncbi:hypothetical protein KEM55_001949 [Ascosphaera atra]|nr:hypothetical protein KEM55_001949 [Ascosphaera atra]